MYLAKTPDFLKPLASSMVWDVKSAEKEIYLSFDDGPDPEITPQVLSILKEFNAKACFFCVGNNVQNNPNIFRSVIDGGHTVGNHTFQHEKGWDTDQNEYLRSVLRCHELVKSNLFRPPYGRITRHQVLALKAKYHIIMWDVLSGDFDPLMDGDKCASNVIKNAKSGSIVVFHDSLKCKEKVLYALPIVLDHFSKLGYSFPALSAEVLSQNQIKNA
jgi:peptidoglycan-N-acetylglucosamine deacetylase